jgi:hypothetical protein
MIERWRHAPQVPATQHRRWSFPGISERVPDVKNPCIDICKFDKKSGWCIGCGRSKDDCRDWKKASKKHLKEIVHDLPRRLKKLKERGKAA